MSDHYEPQQPGEQPEHREPTSAQQPSEPSSPYTPPPAYGQRPTQPGYGQPQGQPQNQPQNQPQWYGQQYGYPGYGQPQQFYPVYGAPATQPGGQPAATQQAGPGSKHDAARRTILVAAVVAALIGGGVGAGTVALTDNGGGTTTAGLTYSSQQAPAAKTDGTVTAAAAKISPSVVTINVTSAQEEDTGSGVILRADGYILTNNHVIASAAGGNASISVTLANGKSARAEITGTDPSDDLAVIKVNMDGLTPATFASSSKLQVGQTVVAVGAPLGLSDTVTSGIVSNLTRPVTTSDSNNDQAFFNAIQTDAAINPGNSGGPLVNLNGDVVGINAAIATDQSQGGLQIPGQQSQSGNIGIGFAIPSDEASRIAGELIRTGTATHAVVGVSVSNNVSSTGASSSSGALVRRVVSGSAADKAGLAVGDVITELDGQRIDDANALVAAVRSHAPGQQVSLTYQRGNDAEHTVTLTLGTGTD